MRQARENYVRRKAGVIRFYCGTPCPSFDPNCFQCQIWAQSPAARWAEVLAGMDEMDAYRKHRETKRGDDQEADRVPA